MITMEQEVREFVLNNPLNNAGAQSIGEVLTEDRDAIHPAYLDVWDEDTGDSIRVNVLALLRAVASK